MIGLIKTIFNLLRLPVDFVFLTIDWLRGLFDTGRIFLEGKRGNKRSCTFCGTPEFLVKEERPCVAASKYGNPWMFKAICPCVKPAKMPDHATPYCTAESAFRKSARHLPISGFLIAITWAAITLGVIKLNPVRHFEQSMIVLKQAEDAQRSKHLETSLSKEDEEAATKEFAKVASALNDQYYEQADKRITDLVNRYPAFYTALPLQAEVYFKQLKHEAALQALENAERAGEKGPRMELLRVKKWVIQGEPDRAIQRLDETQDADEQDPAVLLERATLYLHLNTYSSARSNLVQLLSVEPQHLQGHIRLSSLLFKLQEEDEARAHFSAARAIDPAHPDLRLLDLEINLLDGKEQQVREKLLSLGSDFPDRASIQIKIAKLEIIMQQAGSALVRVEKIPSSVNRHERFAAHMLHAQIMIEHELLTDAERDLDLALAIQPNHLPAQQAKARILMARKIWSAALKILTPLRKKHPRNTILYLMEATCQEHSGDTEQARTLLLRAREILPDNLAIVIRLSNFYQAQGNLQEATHLLKTFVEAHPDNSIAINNLVYLLADQGQDLDHAHRLAQQLMTAHPNNPLFADTIGWVHIQRKAFNEAIPPLEMALRGVPHNPVVLYHLALAYHGSGREDQARAYLERSIDRGVAYKELEQAKTLLRHLQAPSPQP